MINLPENEIVGDLGGAEPVVLSQPSFWRRAGKSLLHDPVALCSALFVLLLVVVAVFAPWIAPYNPLHEFPNGLTDVGAPIAPNGHFLLGTDEAGRDVLSRLIFGARVSLLVGVVATALASTIGVLIGTVAGYVGGVTESILMRFTDMVLSFPILLFLCCTYRSHRPKHPQCGARHSLRILDIPGARGARAGALAQRARVRHRRAHPWCWTPKDHPQTCHAPPHAHDHRLRHPRRRDVHPD